jgi:hypothetical protein
MLNKPPACKFTVGDHVYRFVTIAAGTFQHHGIVVDSKWSEDDEEWMLNILHFTDASKTSTASQQSSSSHTAPTTGLTIVSSPAKEWNFVKYGASDSEIQNFGAGTCTAAATHPTDVVCARTKFLLSHPDILPKYDVLYANCECVAVWCKTGTFATLQVCDRLSSTSQRMLFGAMGLGGVLAAIPVTVPAAGIWGMIGFTAQAPLLMAVPFVLPALLVGGAVAVGAPAIALAIAIKTWKDLTAKLNKAFSELSR